MNNIGVPNSLDPDQAKHSDWADLGPNSLQRSSADEKFAASRQRVMHYLKMTSIVHDALNRFHRCFMIMWRNF